MTVCVCVFVQGGLLLAKKKGKKKKEGKTVRTKSSCRIRYKNRLCVCVRERKKVRNISSCSLCIKETQKKEKKMKCV